MTKSYAQIVKQIESLKQDAERLRRKEVDGVVSRIREAITVYGLTAADLGFTPGGRAKKSAAAPAGKRTRGAGKVAKPTRVVKFRDEASGGTWGGRGKRPQWLRDALANGRKLEEFAVK